VARAAGELEIEGGRAGRRELEVAARQREEEEARLVAARDADVDRRARAGRDLDVVAVEAEVAVRDQRDDARPGRSSGRVATACPSGS
jgi:hypothetical protein